MDYTQTRIKNVVEAYKLAFPDEYKAACEGIQVSRALLKKETGEVTGGIVTGRVLHEIPEKLYQALLMELDSKELEYFKSIEGSRWFTNKFKEFALATKI